MPSVVEIVPHVYQLAIRGVNIILIAEEELTLIDTGLRGSSPKIISFIHSLGCSAEEISLIILTHNHLDHMGGVAELKRFTPARVAAHKADIDETRILMIFGRFNIFSVFLRQTHRLSRYHTTHRLCYQSEVEPH